MAGSIRTTTRKKPNGGGAEAAEVAVAVPAARPDGEDRDVHILGKSMHPEKRRVTV